MGNKMDDELQPGDRGVNAGIERLMRLADQDALANRADISETAVNFWTMWLNFKEVMAFDHNPLGAAS